ncbi:hypothetical protein BAE44_0007321 [Dichanthelium oligosanthes]|uniref:Uncharacterized protein n=1 Tax=Dichanthelium oligosanthes TaxID=888268 RepID=A0A1E5W2U3_9POAL|nr:hypothetical protein BAE44_0007321 [Dichanthelium oligosanthes]
MFRWSKGPAPAAGAGAGATGEVAVVKVPKIEGHNPVIISRPFVYSFKPAPRGGGGGAEGDDINKKAEEFIKKRVQWFHRS